MNKLNVVIIEDEIPAARLLHSMVSGLRPQWTLTMIPGNVDEAVAWFMSIPILILSSSTYIWQTGMPLIFFLRYILPLSLSLLQRMTSMPSVHLRSTVLTTYLSR